MVTQFIISKIKPKKEANQPTNRLRFPFSMLCFHFFVPLAMQIQINEYSFLRSHSILWHHLQWIMNVCGTVVRYDMIWYGGVVWCDVVNCRRVSGQCCYLVVYTNNTSSLAIGMPHPIWHIGVGSLKSALLIVFKWFNTIL